MEREEVLEVTQEGREEAVAWGTKGTHSWGPRATHSWVTEATHEWGGRGEDLCLPGKGVEGADKKTEVLTLGWDQHLDRMSDESSPYFWTLGSSRP